MAGEKGDEPTPSAVDLKRGNRRMGVVDWCERALERFESENHFLFSRDGGPCLFVGAEFSPSGECRDQNRSQRRLEQDDAKTKVIK